MPTFDKSQPSSVRPHLFGWKAILRTAVFSGICAAATASFGQYNVTVLGGGAALGATSTTIYGYTYNSNDYNAATWSRPSNSYSNQNPAGYSASVMNGGSGDHIGGYVYGTASNPYLQDAYIWNTATGTSVDVNPAGSTLSGISGMGGHLATGHAEIGGTEVAEAWDLSNNNQASTLDMTGLSGAFGLATDGIRVVGQGFTTSQRFATYWASTSSTVIDLQALGANASIATSISNNTIAGYGSSVSGNIFAYEWNATTLAGQALNSTGLSYSEAFGTNGDQIVGLGDVSGSKHALVWNVAANTYTDLNGSFEQSTAYAIDAQGDIFGSAYNNGALTAVEWTPQAAPEPSGLLILGGLATLGVVLVRRK